MKLTCLLIVLAWVLPSLAAELIEVDTATGPRRAESGVLQAPASHQNPAAGKIEISYQRFNLMGGSFGSQLGLQIMRIEPDAAHRAIFYGIEGPADNIDRPELVEAHLDRVGEALAADWRVRWLLGDFRTRLAKLLRMIDEHPLEGTVTDDEGRKQRVVVGAHDLKLMLWHAQGLKGYRKRIAQVGRLFIGLRFGYQQPLLEAKWRYCRRIASPCGWELNLSSLLVEAASIPRGIAMPANQRPDPVVFGTETIDPLFYGLPELLDSPSVDPLFLTPVTAATPVLLISGGLDGFTPLVNAREMAAHLPNAHRLHAPMAGHSGWDVLEDVPGLRERTLAFFAGEAEVTDFPGQVDLPPLRVKLLPDGVLMGIAAVMLLLAALVARWLYRRHRDKSA